MKTANLTLEQAKQQYSSASKEVKEFLTTVFGEVFTKSWEEEYREACIKYKYSPLSKEDFKNLPANQQERAFAHHVLATIIKYRNNGWYPDFTKPDCKYYAYLYWDKNSGFGLGYGFAGYDGYGSGDLLMSSRERVEKLIADYPDLLMTILK